jgi:hypothetical protein
MFQCDQLIYIQMQKTGCTHIATLLSNLFDGRQIGKHNAATEDQITSNRYFISSTRNPWEWYLSLWTFGVQGNGALMHRLTKRHFSRCIKSAIKHPKKACAGLLDELSKSVSLWRSVYTRSDDVESFRKWLKLMHNPRNSHFLGEGYGQTVITHLCGFMTYRYLGLCCRNIMELNNSRGISNYADLARFENENCYIDFFIRQESLEDDLCKAVEKLRPLTHEEKELIYSAKKTNTSKRSLSISDYYDEESIELISSRDRLLIEKFDYFAPQIASRSDRLQISSPPFA